MLSRSLRTWGLPTSALMCVGGDTSLVSPVGSRSIALVPGVLGVSLQLPLLPAQGHGTGPLPEAGMPGWAWLSPRPGEGSSRRRGSVEVPPPSSAQTSDTASPLPLEAPGGAVGSLCPGLLSLICVALARPLTRPDLGAGFLPQLADGL